MRRCDAVSLISRSNNMGHWPDENVRINMPGTADNIVRITAHNKLRESFSLTLAMNGRRIEMIGIHSDIGGRYTPGTDSGQVSYSIGTKQPFFNKVVAEWDLRLALCKVRSISNLRISVM